MLKYVRILRGSSDTVQFQRLMDLSPLICFSSHTVSPPLYYGIILDEVLNGIGL